MTEAERKYLNIVKRLVKNNQGHLAGERPPLDRQREFLGVSIAAAAKIEQRVLQAYQAYQLSRRPLPHSLQQASPIPAPTHGIASDQARRSADPDPITGPITGPITDQRLRASSADFSDDQDDQSEVDQFTPTYLPSSEPPATELAPTVIQPPASHAVAPIVATPWTEQAELERTLQQRHWQEADQITLELMLKLTQAQGWLDPAAIGKLPCNLLHQIDRLWRRYSNEKFGFTPQWQVFASPNSSLPSRSTPPPSTRQQPLFNSNAPRSADLDYQEMLRFCKAVGWWQQGEFHKYYRQLAFRKYDEQPALALNHADVPRGHLPALWYWKIPWWRALQLGGVGASRGGCRVDAETLIALMKQFESCEIASKPDAESDRSINPNQPINSNRSINPQQ